MIPAPLMDRTAEEIVRTQPFLGDSIRLSAERYGEEHRLFGEALCRRLLKLKGGNEEAYRKAVRGYCLLSLEYLKLQRQLEKDGRYLLGSFEEAYAKVYSQTGVMDGYYLDGLTLSLLFWPNHYGIHRFFREAFVPGVPAAGACLEIGTGNGVYTATLAEARPGTSIEGLDVSPHSLAYTRAMLSAWGIPEGATTLTEGDVAKGLPFGDAAFAATVCGEVMEHLDDPLAALREIRRVTAPGGPVFLNIAVFAANIDHVYLFHSTGEARELVRKAGLEIGPELALPVRPGDDPEKLDVPVNYACVARRLP